MKNYGKNYDLNVCYSEFINRNETSGLNFDGRKLTVVILQKNPKKELVDEILNSNPFFQIYSKNNIIFLLIKFGENDWIDIPYIFEGSFVHKIEDDVSGYPCEIFFANNHTGELLAKKYSCLSNGLSKAFYFAIEKQKGHLPKNVSQKINKIRASFHPNEIARLSLGR